MTFYIGVDLGGTHIRAGIVDVNTGKIINRRKILVKREDGFSAVLGRLMEVCEDQLETAIKRGISISGMGIGVPGQVDQSYKLIIRLPNFSDDWSNLNLADKVKKKTNLHCYVYNDAQCITFGEFLFGAGFGYRSGMCLVIGTGVGSGLFLNGQLVVGRSGVAGEVGHIVVDEEGALCGCGNYGCLETIVSGPAITSQGVRAVLQGLNTELTGYSGRNICKINSKLISELAKKGDSVSINIYQRAGRYLGIVISDIVNILSPERIVISGGLSAAGDILLKPVRDAIKQRVKIVKYRNDLVVQGTLGDYAGVIGSAISAHRQR